MDNKSASQQQPATVQLQWGHIIEDVDTGRILTKESMAVVLQWSHIIEDVDISA